MPGYDVYPIPSLRSAHEPVLQSPPEKSAREEARWPERRWLPFETPPPRSPYKQDWQTHKPSLFHLASRKGKNDALLLIPPERPAGKSAFYPCVLFRSFRDLPVPISTRTIFTRLRQPARPMTEYRSHPDCARIPVVKTEAEGEKKTVSDRVWRSICYESQLPHPCDSQQTKRRHFRLRNSQTFTTDMQKNGISASVLLKD